MKSYSAFKSEVWESAPRLPGRKNGEATEELESLAPLPRMHSDSRLGVRRHAKQTMRPEFLLALEEN